jgi:hypothetical protein
MKTPQHGQVHGQQSENMFNNKVILQGGSKRPWLSHKISWTLGSTSFGALEVSTHGQHVLGLKNAREMQVLKDPNLEISLVIGQVMKRLRFVEVCKFENKHTNQMSKHR